MNDAFAAPATLFDLSGFAHGALFDGLELAWQALAKDRLAAFLRALGPGALLGTVEEGAFVSGAVHLAEGAIIEAGAYVRGPALLGPGTVVRHGAYLRGDVLAGRDCVLGHATEVKNSIFLDGAKAGHFAYVGDSILGNGVNLGAGTKLANFRVFPGNVNVTRPDGARVDSGLRKLGAILGDEVEIGCNAVTQPGTVVGRRTRIYALAPVRGTVPPDTLLRFAPALEARPLEQRS